MCRHDFGGHVTGVFSSFRGKVVGANVDAYEVDPHIIVARTVEAVGMSAGPGMAIGIPFLIAAGIAAARGKKDADYYARTGIEKGPWWSPIDMPHR